MLEITAPGKLILCGEHAVVYGKKALACAINLRTCLRASRHDDFNDFEVNLVDLDLVLRVDETQHSAYLSMDLGKDLYKTNSMKALVCMFQLMQGKLTWTHLRGFKIDIKSDIPLASGLGSSAAFSVCLATFFLSLTQTWVIAAFLILLLR